MGFRVATRSAASEWVAAFAQRLHELGWIEGRTVTIEYRWSEGRAERFAQIAAEFVQLKVDVIVTSGTPQVLAAKQATSVIPIVFATAGDPVTNGLVASLARPGGNVTGLSLQSNDPLASGLNSCARLFQISAGWRSWPISVIPLGPGDGEAHAAARAIGLEVETLEIRRPEDIAPAFEALRGDGRHFIFVPRSRERQSDRINTLALAARLPTMHGYRDYVEAGGLMAYGANLPDLFRRSADYVDKILHGAKAATSRSSSRPSLISP